MKGLRVVRNFNSGRYLKNRFLNSVLAGIFITLFNPILSFGNEPEKACHHFSKTEQIPFRWNYCIWKNPKSKTNLFVFHGRGGDAEIWDTNQELLKLRQIIKTQSVTMPNVIAVSFPGVQAFWLLINKRYQVFTESMLEFIENREQIIPQTRVGLGLSMGGFNLLQIYFNRPEIFSKFAVLCPMTPTFLPWGPATQLIQYIKRTGAQPMFAFLLNLALGVRLGFYKISDILEKETLWKKYDPIYLAKNMDSRFRGPVFLSANQSDHYGFPEGTHFLLENLKERRFPVEFHLRPGDHCTDLAVPDLANFLASEQ